MYDCHVRPGLHLLLAVLLYAGETRFEVETRLNGS